jgi:predicted CDP-diglyceride synthetase/phosphatidate cytidylyltransferase
MYPQISSATILTLFAIQTLVNVSTLFINCPARVKAYTRHMWLYLLFFVSGKAISTSFAIGVLSIICFLELREYFSLINIRPQDRFALWGGFLAIVFMICALLIHDHELFIFIMPLYAFFLIPLLVSVGGKEPEGTVFSVGAIGCGLFLFVFGNGLIGFLTLYMPWVAIILFINVSLSDAIAFGLYSTGKRLFTGKIIQYLAAVPITVAITTQLTALNLLSLKSSIMIGAVTPLLVAISRYIMFHIESDLGIARDYQSLRRGRLINSCCSLVMVTPIIFFIHMHLL